MQQLYAQIVADQAAELITKIAGLNPASIEVAPGSEALAEGSLTLFIEFRSVSAAQRGGGRLLCSCPPQDDGQWPLIQAIARTMGFDQSLMDSPDGPANILGEYLNMVMGLAAADWAEQGFQIYFSTPKIFNSLQVPTNSPGRFQMTIITDCGARLDLRLSFSPR